MKKIKVLALLLISFMLVGICMSCETTPSEPVFHSELSLDDDLNITDMGRIGQRTPDGKYYYNGSVTLYDTDGGSQRFDCYLGTEGLENGCRGIIVNGIFYNLDRNKWVIIYGTKYRAADLVD